MIIGIFLIIVGFLWLLDNLGLIATQITQVLGPLIVIALGFAFLLKRTRHNVYFGSKDEDKKE